ncbi:hypothetical protein D7X33_15000 [Butyricicoccus sp. 1XD8-22]|nr:hypothetical protein D7X33_15000 [Butyricicoccus sp. 1XD8-22]
MKAYYRELMKFVPHSIQIAEREDLRHLWKLEPYPCLDIFEDFYECFQNAPDIRTAFFKILPIEEIHIRNGGLVFSIGYKSTYPAGVEISDLAYEDPRVKYQTHENGVWYNESLNLRSYLFNVAAWQILHTMNITAHIKIRNEKNLEKIIGDSLFFIGEDRSVRLGSNYLTCQNAEKNILAVFNRLNGYLHFGADDESILTDFIKSNYPSAKIHGI